MRRRNSKSNSQTGLGLETSHFPVFNHYGLCGGEWKGETQTGVEVKCAYRSRSGMRRRNSKSNSQTGLELETSHFPGSCSNLQTLQKACAG
uniref:Uncharacterized protein n=1 Tax=Ascaris lumbricoides TaxID=6252 RepID=A0A0M3I9F3_ASCLU